MIRFNATDSNGRRILGIGVTKELMARLLQGEMVVWNFGDTEIVLVGGDTEMSITKTLKDKGMITDATNMHMNDQLFPPLIKQ